MVARRSVAFVILLIAVAARAVFAITEGENSQPSTNVLFLAHRLWFVLVLICALRFPNIPSPSRILRVYVQHFCSLLNPASIFASWIFLILHKAVEQATLSQLLFRMA